MEGKPEKVEYKSIKDLVDKMPVKRGAKAFLVPKMFIGKIRDKWNKMKEKLTEYVGEDTVQEKIQAKEEKIENKINDWNNYVSSIESHLVENSNVKSNANIDAALSYSKNKIEELKRKQVKVSSKGLGIFALSTMAIKKLASDKFYELKQKIEKRRETKIEEKNAKKAEKREEIAKKRIARENKKSERNELLKQILEELRESNKLRRQQIELMMYGNLNHENSELQPVK